MFFGHVYFDLGTVVFFFVFLGGDFSFSLCFVVFALFLLGIVFVVSFARFPLELVDWSIMRVI